MVIHFYARPLYFNSFYSLQTPVSEQVEVVSTETEADVIDNPEYVKEHDAQDFTSNKKTDEQSGMGGFSLLIQVNLLYSNLKAQFHYAHY